MRMSLPAFHSKLFPFEKYKSGCAITHLQLQHLRSRQECQELQVFLSSPVSLRSAWATCDNPVSSKTKYHRAMKRCAQNSHKYKTTRELISVRKLDPNQAHVRTKPRVLSPYQSGECLPLVTLNLRELHLATLGKV